MWAAGAVVGEMLAGRPLFQGRSDIDQLHKILQVRIHVCTSTSRTIFGKVVLTYRCHSLFRFQLIPGTLVCGLVVVVMIMGAVVV